MTEEEYKKKLTPEQYRVLREKGTEDRLASIILIMMMVYIVALLAVMNCTNQK
jgi:hypothetical protein